LSRASNVAARPSAPGEFNGIIARLLSQFRDDSCDLLITNKHCYRNKVIGERKLLLTPRYQPKMIWDSNPDFRIKQEWIRCLPDRSQNVVDSYLVSIHHSVKNRVVTA